MPSHALTANSTKKRLSALGWLTRPSPQGPVRVPRGEGILPSHAPQGAVRHTYGVHQSRPCSPPRTPGRRRAGKKDRLPDIGRALRREGILPSLAPSGALAAFAKERRLAAPGKAECLPSRRRPFPRRINHGAREKYVGNRRQSWPECTAFPSPGRAGCAARGLQAAWQAPVRRNERPDPHRR